MGVGDGGGEAKGEGSDDAGWVGECICCGLDAFVGQGSGVQGRVHRVEDLFAGGRAAGVVVGNGGAGQDGDELGLLSGRCRAEQGGQRDVAFDEGAGGVVFGDAVGLEGAPVAVAVGRVQGGEPRGGG